MIWQHLYKNDMAAFNRIKLFCLIKLTLHSAKVLSSLNSPILFDIIFWEETNRSNLSQMFFKVDVLKNFTNFARKHQCWSLFLIKLQAWRRLQHRCFSVKFEKFFRRLAVAVSEQTREVSVVRCVAKSFFGHFAHFCLGCPISC